MKKLTKRLLAIGLCIVLVLGVTALAATTLRQGREATIVFDAAAQSFTINNIPVSAGEAGREEAQYLDLFPEMKNLMPGDTVDQTIRIRVKNAGTDTVKLTLKAESRNDDYDTLMGYRTESGEGVALSVQLEGSDYADQLAYTGEITGLADSAVDTAEGVYLGAYTDADSEKTMTVTLDIPLEAGNELQGLTAELGWVIVAEIIPTQTSLGGITALTDGPGGTTGTVTAWTAADATISILDEEVPLAGLDLTEHGAYLIGRDDGLFHPEAAITRGEVATAFFRLLTDEARETAWSTVNTYVDVSPDLWCNNAISTLSHLGVLEGYPDGTFRPNAAITRAEFAAMALRFYIVTFSGDDRFSDMDGHWAREAVNGAAAYGILEGYPDGTFRPDENITRAETATILNRVLQRYPDKDHLLPDMITWPDNLDTGLWYYAAVQEATNSHEYEWATGDDGTMELWTALQPVRDWAALEAGWAAASAGPVTVASSEHIQS
jgi:hypothetical protein